ncbi:hypothetical protein P5673_002103 [Acropora cervicornis]|uniref:Uncharacterized protein n=1 Tax=Acropora cervicornis TaxID=6130 RepID=A0AAD9R4T3_ACRCE|nr:hypothetical protein P5673_002103 [Acropora cervicornis]
MASGCLEGKIEILSTAQGLAFLSLHEFRKLRHAIGIKVADCCSVSTAQRRFPIISLFTSIIGTFLGEVSRPSLMQ